uniref:NADH-ubiquinone oxidoreductase chain 3 n=1 Tax=Acleris fimbriana TaxID=941637 RepID=J9PEF4_9NEOP|nr:NADH dehydrogenase subunit 3 [Acleris fimbriana]ADU58120.1 NADH dehydrogenase subunit 3 [Acleris fimbriana]UDU84871.1 NADH dehydrogenase subunit 3 [Acleris fimbriana]
MFIILIISMIFIFLSNIMMFLSMILSKKTFHDREKSSPFECGFDPSSSPRIPFSLHFFLITIIFLIFDVEIALIFPMISNFMLVNLITWSKISYFFMIILILGLYHEWNQNMLKWTN